MLICEIRGFEVECLERRTHLAAAPLSAYYPLEPGSKWIFNVIEDGVAKTETQGIARTTVAIHDQRAFQRVRSASDGTGDVRLENFSATRQLQLHAIIDSVGKVTFASPVRFPRLLQAGAITRTHGAADVLMTSRRLTGNFFSEITVGGKERVKVRAGTFGAVRIEFKLEMTLDYHKRGDTDINLQIHDVQTLWLAKGVGIVKTSDVFHNQRRINGQPDTIDGTSTGALRRYVIPN
jgi:hypothetical protein